MIKVIACLINSFFIFSLSLSFAIDLYNLILLTPNAKIAGMNIKFCKHNPNMQNKIPENFPRLIEKVPIVNPKHNPLYRINNITIGIPTIVVPAIHIKLAKVKLFFIDTPIISLGFNLSIFLNLFIKSLIYVLISWIWLSSQLFIISTPIKIPIIKAKPQ